MNGRWLPFFHLIQPLPLTSKPSVGKQFPSLDPFPSALYLPPGSSPHDGKEWSGASARGPEASRLGLGLWSSVLSFLSFSDGGGPAVVLLYLDSRFQKRAMLSAWLVERLVGTEKIGVGGTDLV